MNEEIKNALKICTTPGSCEGCPFLDAPDCDSALKNAALNTIRDMETTVVYLQALNNKLKNELMNSTFLEGEQHYAQ